MTNKQFTDDPFEYPIDGSLNLHQFSHKETREVLDAFIDSCLEKQIFNLRIIHGKGIGVQREIVKSALSSDTRVASFKHEGGTGGGWGATIVKLVELDRN